MYLISIGVAIIVIGLYFISIYNFFQVTKTRIQASIQEIGNQLKRQANLIPNLVEATKGYLKHEKGIFDQLTAARQTILSAANNPKGVDKAIATMDKLMPQFIAIVESNPQLKADTVVAKLMDEVRDTSDKLMYSRRSLIDLSADYNAKLVTFPTNLVANMFGFVAEKGLQTPSVGKHMTVSDAETKDQEIKL